MSVTPAARNTPEPDVAPTDIAIVGMALRVPGANSPADYWANVRGKVESIRRYSEDELRAAGVDESLLANPNYVRAGGPIEHMEMFDAAFFGFGPRDAAIMDPQHRHFLECCWEALEDAGLPPGRFPGAIGVFAGCGMGAYFTYNVLSNPELLESVGLFLLRHTGNDKDFLPTRVSYCLDLRGPSVAVQTACSTSLVAVHLACQSLMAMECDMALAGGITIEQPHRQGYLFKENEILSPDGHCRAFAAESKGTVLTSGGGVVALRRLADALRDGDPIHAVIKATAVNNDGAGKVGYLAPSVDGHAAVVAEALALSGIDARSIALFEAHGTGTQVGDPIEIAALTQAWREHTKDRGFCAIGSVKTNIGHLDTAAGVAGLIKVARAVAAGELPPSLHFERPNPIIDFAASPFFVNTELRPWPAAAVPRRAAMSSLGVGGTNAHAIVEEPPARPQPPASPPWHLLVFSGKSARAADGNANRLRAHLAANPGLDLADVAYTLTAGRMAFDHRRAVAVRDVAHALEVLAAPEARTLAQGIADGSRPKVVFLFPGGGAQHLGMGRGLAERFPVYRRALEECFAALPDDVQAMARALVSGADGSLADEAVQQTVCALPALFAVEHALARLLMAWGIEPDALTGHSLGEYTAACLAGVMSLADAMALIVLRARLQASVPAGGILSVPLPEAELRPLLDGELSLAAVNGPELCAVSGPDHAVAALEAVLEARGVESRRLRIAVAAHSALLDPVLDEFRDGVRRLRLQRPTRPFLSNLTGTWADPAEVCTPEYWVRHLRQTVRFGDGIRTLLAEERCVLVEVGPGTTLSTLARMQRERRGSHTIVSAMRHPQDQTHDVQAALLAVGQIWCAGVEPEWNALRGDVARQRLSLPTYAFDHQRYWIEPGSARPTASADSSLTRLASIDDWFHRRAWVLAPLAPAAPAGPGRFLVFLDDDGPGAALAAALRAAGHEVATVERGPGFAAAGERRYAINPDEKLDYEALWTDLGQRGFVPGHVVHTWTARGVRPGAGVELEESQVLGFYSLLLLSQAIVGADVEAPLRLTVVTAGSQRVLEEDVPSPEHATVLGPVLVLPRELPNVRARCIDVALPPRRRRGFDARSAAGTDLVARLVAEVTHPGDAALVALRPGGRFVQRVEAMPVPATTRPVVLRPDGAYLVTGGLGGIGLQVARGLAASGPVKLALLSRTGLPPRADWPALRAAGGGGALLGILAAIEELEAAGATVAVMRGDVGDREGLRRCVADVVARLGPVRGVIHAAGTIEDGLIPNKQPISAERVLAPKVRGTLNLEAALADQPLDFFVMFSSTSGVLGLPGQVDYTAANAFLDAFAAARARATGTQYLALGWGVWAEVGMAAQALRPQAAGEVRDTGHPWLGVCVADTPQGARYEVSYDARRLWLLDEHRVKGGRALVPGTGYFELARAALHKGTGGTAMELHDLTLLAPLEVDDGATTDVVLDLARGGGEQRFTVRARATGEGGWRECATARLGFIDDPAPPALDLDAIRARCGVVRRTFAPYGQETRQERHLDFGPRWKVLRSLDLGRHEALAGLELVREVADDVASIPLHPALLDLACHCGLPLLPGYDACEDLFVPMAVKRARVFGRLPARVMSHVRVAPAASARDEIVAFDVTVTDAAGHVLVVIDQFLVRRLRDRAAISSRRPAVQPDETPAPAREGTQDELLVTALRAGIRPQEGWEALQRALAHRVVPQALVTPLRVQALLERVDRMAAPPVRDAARFSRPELDGEFTAPRTDIERKVAALWQDLLGVDRIGVTDDFFLLGGQSLIAVRMFARVKRLWGIDLPLATLFEAPTVEKLAAVVAAETGLDPATATPSGQPAAPVRRRDWTTLVPIQSKGGRTPFYCAAGQGGNAMNLRHVAVHLGEDQPFYGLQARGVDGRLRPHETVEAMAAEYVADIRRFQPQGPYLVGGYSGGGTVAFEMAHQLTAAGERVEALVFLDSYSRAMPERTRVERIRLHLRRLLAQGPGYAFEKLRDRLVLHDFARVRRFLVKPLLRWFPDRFREDSMVYSWSDAFLRYQPRPWDGVAHLLRVKLDEQAQWSGVRVEEDLGWRGLVRELVVREVPGDHNSMCQEPNARVVADVLRACLDAAHERMREHAAPAASGSVRPASRVAGPA